MTLLEMAGYVADKVRQNDAAAQARCKGFLNRRYEMIWNEALWRASVFGHDFTMQPGAAPSTVPGAGLPFNNQWCNAAGVQCLPPTVDRVLAVRRTDAGVRVEQAEALYRMGIDEFEEEGQPVKFLVLPRAVVDLSRFPAADLEGHGVTAEGAADVGAAVRVKYIDTKGQERAEDLTLSASESVVTTQGPLVVLSATKPVTTADVDFTIFDDATFLFSIPLADMAAARHPRIRLIPRPTEDTAFKCLVKKRATVLSDDGDEPELVGVENALMAFAQADMLQHARQYGKASEVHKEGLGLLEQYKQMEVVQQAHRAQVVPDVEEMSGDWETSKAWYV